MHLYTGTHERAHVQPTHSVHLDKTPFNNGHTSVASTSC